ncbi:MAG: hypothetical protein HZB42_09830 [Sphingobacteriales bacterium]|nr:hypothetical protein [Sphingobacteriales bacterium]
MKKLPLLVLLCAGIINLPLKAQYYYYDNKYYEADMVMEFGITGGIMNSFTDLGGKKGKGRSFIKDLRWKPARAAYGGYVMTTYKNALGIRLELTIGKVVGYDSILKNVASSTGGRYERNLSFESKISEFHLGAELYPMNLRYHDPDEEPSRLSPYGTVGVGYFSFDPQARLNGQWYALQPLHTEGQGFKEYKGRKPYKLHQLNYTLGMGLKFELSPMLNLRMELLHRILTTDYLDDVSTTYIDPTLFSTYLTPSQAAVAEKLYNRKGELNPNDDTAVGDQRGDPKDKDAYFTIMIKFGVMFGRPPRK